MPQRERRGGAPTLEQALPGYHQAVRFPGEEPAGIAHFAAQGAEEAVAADAGHVDLSAYRFLLDRVSYVVVLEDVLKLLNARRAQATEVGPWVKGHYRPGKRLT